MQLAGHISAEIKAKDTWYRTLGSIFSMTVSSTVLSVSMVLLVA